MLSSLPLGELDGPLSPTSIQHYAIHCLCLLDDIAELVVSFLQVC